MRKILSACMAAIMLMLCGCAQNATDSTESVSSTSGSAAENADSASELVMDTLNIGKADCIVIQCGGNTMMIDTGLEDTSSEVLKYLSDNNITKLDCLIITHYDKDHVGGAADILAAVETDKIYAPNYEGNNAEYREFIALAENLEGFVAMSAAETTEFTIGDAAVALYAPEKEEYKETDNDYSIVTKITHGENSFLLAGDAEKKRVKELLEYEDLGSTYLKLPHHGISEKNSDEFFEAVGAEYAVITCTQDEPGEDELAETAELLEKAGTDKIYYTYNGAVRAVSDGKTLTVTQSQSD